MDDFTTQHLERWLEQTCNEDFRDARRTLIVAFVADYPDILARGDSWPQILALAERDEALSGRHGFEVHA